MEFLSLFQTPSTLGAKDFSSATSGTQGRLRDGGGKFLIRFARFNTFPLYYLRAWHKIGISALVSQTSFGGETSDSVAKCRLFSQATPLKALHSA